MMASASLRKILSAQDWAGTPLGPCDRWPVHLRSTLNLCLDARYPLAIYWGPDLVLLYNDEWRPILGNKHPWAMGRPAREVWAEIWDIIGPMFQHVFTTGEGTRSSDQLLPMLRHGYIEECYFDYTFSPIRGDDGRVDGIFNAVTETTYRVLAERRARVLRDLSERTSAARTAEQVCVLAAESLHAARHDVPFLLLYLVAADGQRARLAACSGVEPGSPLAPEQLPLGPDHGTPPTWPATEAVQCSSLIVVSELGMRFGPLVVEPWPEPVSHAVVSPVAATGKGGVAGLLVTGVNPRRALDDNYRDFLDRLAGHIATALANARAYEEERQRAQALTELDRAKTTFFSNVSHEFRTPLTLMLGPLEDLLLDAGGHLDAATLDKLRVAHRNSQRLLKLVNALLDFSRIEAGRVRLTFRPTNLAQLTAELAGTFRTAIEKAGLQLWIDCPPLPEPVFVDHETWEKIVLNLLSNAFKYTLEGSISVSMRVRDREMHLDVADTGIGISAADLPLVFDRFHRVEGAQGRTQEGTGIGLALVQELVRMHGGHIAAESTVGAGTTFRVSLPLGTQHLNPERIDDEAPATLSALGAAPFVEEALRWLPWSAHEVAPAYDLSGEVQLPSASRARVLVADDNADMREYVARLLRGRYEVEAVSDGAAALSAARRRRPHLVLSDVMMPVMDGFALLRAFRDDEGLRDVPFVLLSARAGEESRVEGLQAGADDYLVKPFSARELLARVEGTLQLARLRNDTARQIANLNRELEDRLAELQTLLEVIPVGIGVALDPECRHIRANPALARILGIGTGRNASLTAADDERPQSFCVLDDHGREVPPAQLPMQISAREGRFVREIELNVLHDDGRRIRLLEYASPLFDKSGAPRGCVGAFIDITERERIEARNKFLVRLDDAIRPLTDASEITHAAARLLAEQLDVDRCAYADVEDLDEDTFNLTGDYNRGVPSIVGRYRFSAFGQEVLQKMRDNQPYIVDDVLAHEPPITDRTLYEQTQIRAVICVPLHKGGRFAAAMAVHQRTARHWTAGEVELVELVASRCWESIERARVTRDLLESEERLRMAVAAARIGYWTWELEAELVQLDTTCAELLGIATPQATAEVVMSAIHPDDRSSVEQAVRHAIEGRGPYKVEFRVILADGETRWLSGRGNAVRVAGRVCRLSGVNMDITEQIQLAEQREQLLESERAARASAERAGRMKDEFLATLSHELRTPLNAVLGYATLMKFASMNPVEVAEAVDAIERNARLQAQLIEDLLDMNRIMSGKIRLDVQTLSLDEVIKSALDTVLPSAESKGVRIQEVVDPSAGPVRGDPARLQQVIWNLLSNAIKFTPRDGSVQIALERVDSHVEITVSDTGQGIKADFLPFVFDRFRQADPSTTRRHGGLGLGLSIVKHLVDLHGGSVRVSSPGEGQGATFVVSLPLAIIHHRDVGNASRAALAALSDSPDQGVDLSGVRVLVVDDEPDATVLVKRILEECRATVTTAHSAQEALEAVQQHPFEVLVSDIGMPGQDGFQLLRAIRSLEGPRAAIPAVALTAFARSEDRRRAALAGFQTHLSKPVEIAELIAVVGNLAGRTKPPA